MVKTKIPEDVTTVEEFMELPGEEKIKAREALYKHPKLFDSFVRKNPFNFSQDELEIVKSWKKNFIKDEFYLFRYLKKYAIFLDDSSPPKAYGVLALKSDFHEMAGEAMREKYWEEIEKLIKKDSNLLTVYHQEMGKVHARTFGRRLSEIGLRNAWFAILEGEIVAGGSTREEVERILDGIIPMEKRNFAYIFHLRGR